MNVNLADMNGESSNSENDQHNECSKHCNGPSNGARPKMKHIVCNIPNGVVNNVENNEAAKVNNNEPVTGEDKCTKTDSNLVFPVAKVLNGINSNKTSCSEEDNCMDSYLHNNVNFNSQVDKCPLKVRNCSAIGPPNGQQLDVKNDKWRDDSSSSDTGNEGEDILSAADECCIYTYKGDQLADLPSSFFRLDIQGGVEHSASGGEMPRTRHVCESQENCGSSSPEMDFLEMDFDPGPSCGQYSDDEDSDSCELRDEEAAFSPLEPAEFPQESVPVQASACEIADCFPSTSSSTPEDSNGAMLPLPPTPPPPPPCVSSQGALTPAKNNPDTASLPSTSSWLPRDTRGHHCTGADLCSPGEVDDGGYENISDNVNASLYHCLMAKRLLMGKKSFSSEDPPRMGSSEEGRTMIWTEQEACAKNVTQIGTSQCGATAVINVLAAFNIPYSIDKVKASVKTRFRAESAPLPQYIASRSVAGATHDDLIRGLHEASNGLLYARFVHMYPERVPSLTHWLTRWMRKGAIPIATLNLQRGVAPGIVIPDAWHHQMIFGVGPQGVYLCNPLECVREEVLWPQLSSPSELMIRRHDVLVRWDMTTDLRCLAEKPWSNTNVLGQIVNTIREASSLRIRNQELTTASHIVIPAAYSSGITLVISRESPNFPELQNCVDLLREG